MPDVPLALDTDETQQMHPEDFAFNLSMPVEKTGDGDPTLDNGTSDPSKAGLLRSSSPKYVMYYAVLVTGNHLPVIFNFPSPS